MKSLQLGKRKRGEKKLSSRRNVNLIIPKIQSGKLQSPIEFTDILGSYKFNVIVGCLIKIAKMQGFMVYGYEKSHAPAGAQIFENFGFQTLTLLSLPDSQRRNQRSDNRGKSPASQLFLNSPLQFLPAFLSRFIHPRPLLSHPPPHLRVVNPRGRPLIGPQSKRRAERISTETGIALPA